MNDSVKELDRLLRGIRVAMLTSVEADGRLYSRPMATQQAEFDGTLWFFTRGGAPKVEEIARNPHVNVVFIDSEDRERFISVCGTAEIVKERSKAAELWSPAYLAWFPQGLEDPELLLLKVSVSQAEYWDSPSGPGVLLSGFSGPHALDIEESAA